MFKTQEHYGVDLDIEALERGLALYPNAKAVHEPSTPSRREAFLGGVRRRIVQSFADRPGAKTIICCKTKSVQSRWEQRIVRDTVLTPFALRFALHSL